MTQCIFAASWENLSHGEIVLYLSLAELFPFTYSNCVERFHSNSTKRHQKMFFKSFPNHLFTGLCNLTCNKSTNNKHIHEIMFDLLFHLGLFTA